MWNFLAESAKTDGATTISSLATGAQKSEIPKKKTKKHPIIKMTESEIITFEQLIQESISDSLLSEGDDFDLALGVYVEQLENDSVDEKLEESLSIILFPYFENNSTIFEAFSTRGVMSKKGGPKGRKPLTASSKMANKRPTKQVKQDVVKQTKQAPQSFNNIVRGLRKSAVQQSKPKSFLSKLSSSIGKSRLAGALKKAGAKAGASYALAKSLGAEGVNKASKKIGETKKAVKKSLIKRALRGDKYFNRQHLAALTR